MMEKVKGFSKLTPEQQNILIVVNRMHKAGVGVDYKDGFTPVEVSAEKRGILKVRFKNGAWLHYTVFGEWY